jgi:hypothetical protein
MTSAVFARSIHSLSFPERDAFVPLYSSGRSQNVRSPTSHGSHSTFTRDARNSQKKELPPRYVYSHPRPVAASADPARATLEARAARRTPWRPEGLDATAPTRDALAADISGRGGRVKKTTR